MYNALEEGLNYLENPAKNIPEAENTKERAEQVLQACQNDPTIAVPVNMLRNTLVVLLEEMKAPRDPVMEQRMMMMSEQQLVFSQKRSSRLR